MGLGKQDFRSAFARRLQALGIVVFLCLLSQPAFAASFDCAKARTGIETGIEKQICADADVSRQDGLLQETYEKLLKEVADPERLKAEQRAWIKARDRCLGKGPETPICLSLAYYARRGRLETDLFLRDINAGKAETGQARHPDMWLSRFDVDSSVGGRLKVGDVYFQTLKLFRFNRAFQQKLGLQGRIDDYFYLDDLPSWLNKGFGKYLLRGFFSGEIIPVVPTDKTNSAFVSQNGVEIASDLGLAPLPVSIWTAEDTTVPLSDGTALRRKAYFLWNTGTSRADGPDPCERGTWALERIDASGTAMWSQIYLLDAGTRWYRTCGPLYSLDDNSKEEVELQKRRVTFNWDEYLSLSVYLLDDGTFLIPSNAYVLRLALRDGRFGRAGIGAAAIDSGKMMALKEAYRPNWEARHAEAIRKIIECLGTAKRTISSKEYDLLARTKCRREYDDPAKDSALWYLNLNAEIERIFLYPQSEQTNAE